MNSERWIRLIHRPVVWMDKPLGWEHNTSDNWLWTVNVEYVWFTVPLYGLTNSSGENRTFQITEHWIRLADSPSRCMDGQNSSGENRTLQETGQQTLNTSGSIPMTACSFILLSGSLLSSINCQSCNCTISYFNSQLFCYVVAFCYIPSYECHLNIFNIKFSIDFNQRIVIYTWLL